MQRIQPANEEIYHVYNRGVDKRTIFEEERDYLRFVHDLFEFNDQDPVLNIHYHFRKNRLGQSHKTRKMMVEILAFCLMPNHYHLMLRQIAEDGISEFMKKIGGGYTNYFNKKYERSGSLLQGKYKAIHVHRDAYFTYLPFYIHLNPLDLAMPRWREQGIRNKGRAIKILDSYRWSSHLDYKGKKNFPSVTQRDFLQEHFGGERQYERDLLRWASKGLRDDGEDIFIG